METDLKPLLLGGEERLPEDLDVISVPFIFKPFIKMFVFFLSPPGPVILSVRKVFAIARATPKYSKWPPRSVLI